MIRHICPKCGKRNESSAHLAGMEQACHTCGEPLVVPVQEEAPPHAESAKKSRAPVFLDPKEYAVRGLAGVFATLGLASLLIAFFALLHVAQGASLPHLAIIAFFFSAGLACWYVAYSLWVFRPSARPFALGLMAAYLAVQLILALFFRAGLGLTAYVALIFLNVVLMCAFFIPSVVRVLSPRHRVVAPVDARHLHDLLSHH